MHPVRGSTASVAALEAVAEAKQCRFRGARLVVALRSGSTLLVKEELASHYALRRLADKLRQLGFEALAPDASCRDCDAVFEERSN